MDHFISDFPWLSYKRPPFIGDFPLPCLITKWYYIASLLGVSKATALSVPQSRKTCISTGVINHGNGKSLANGHLESFVLGEWSMYTLGNIGIANCSVWFPKGTYGTETYWVSSWWAKERSVGEKEHPWQIRSTGYLNELSTSVAWILHPKIEESWNDLELLHKYSHNSSSYVFI